LKTFICQKCNLISLEPLKSSGNNKIYCKNCIEIDGRSEENDYVIISKEEQAKLESLDIPCKNRTHGCLVIFNVKNKDKLVEHELQCDFHKMTDQLQLEKPNGEIPIYTKDVFHFYRNVFTPLFEMFQAIVTFRIFTYLGGIRISKKSLIIFLLVILILRGISYDNKLIDLEYKLYRMRSDIIKEMQSSLKILRDTHVNETMNGRQEIMQKIDNLQNRLENQLNDRYKELKEYISQSQTKKIVKDNSQNVKRDKKTPEEEIKGEFRKTITESQIFEQILKSKKLRILFSGKENGFKASIFHKLSDGHKNTITIIRTENNDIIGGFTPTAWENLTTGRLRDNTFRSFLFSLTKNKKLLQKSDVAISYSQKWGPVFGENDLLIADECDKNYNSYLNIGGSYHTDKYNKKIYGFKVINYEVYEVVEN